jgi:hypothetical protein
MIRRLALACCGVLVLAGCTSLWGEKKSVRSQSPEEPKRPGGIKLVGDWAVSFGMNPVRVENVGLVVGLPGTGSDPPPSADRATLIGEMRSRGVESPNSILASKTASLVYVRAYLRAGIQKGDRVDVEIRVPTQSETVSLAGGHLLETNLSEMGVMPDDRQLHKGFAMAIAKGPVLVDPNAKDANDKIRQGRGMILGGAVAVKSRKLGLVLRSDHQTEFNAARIATAVNKRFHTSEKGIQTGMAKAKNNQFIELDIHPRYRQNVERYLQVVFAVAIKETPVQQAERVKVLKEELLDPVTSGDAARQLEAIGHESEETLLTGLKSSSEEVRFFAAEALAYLDRHEAAEVLGQVAANSPAFRVFAMTALSTMNHRAAYEQLANLLHANSAETRYGAFRALWAMNPNDALVADDPTVKTFSYHVIDSQGPPMVHVTRSRRAEIVLFGKDQCFRTPLAINAGNSIMITSIGRDEVTVSKFAVNQPDQKRTVSTRVDDVVRAIAELGGSYPDVLHALEAAKTGDSLASRFAVDALPEAGREYDRVATTDSDDGEDKAKEGAKTKSSTTKSKKVKTTDLFSKSDIPDNATRDEGEKKSQESDADSAKKEAPKKGFVARIMGRGSD